MTFYAWLTARTAHSGALGDFARWATAPATALPPTIDTLDALNRWLRENGKATYVPLAKLVLTAYYNAMIDRMPARGDEAAWLS